MDKLRPRTIIVRSRNLSRKSGSSRVPEREKERFRLVDRETELARKRRLRRARRGSGTREVAAPTRGQLEEIRPAVVGVVHAAERTSFDERLHLIADRRRRDPGLHRELRWSHSAVRLDVDEQPARSPDGAGLVEVPAHQVGEGLRGEERRQKDIETFIEHPRIIAPPTSAYFSMLCILRR